MNRFRSYYGANWIHLFAMACCFTVVGYAAVRLLTGRTLAITLWFIGGALLHDLVLVPLYSGADLAARTALPPRPVPPRWINYLRVPFILSGLLLLVWFPLIVRRPALYRPYTALSSGVYLGRWLLITAVLFAAGAVVAIAVATRRRRNSRRRPADTGSTARRSEQ